MIKINLRLLIVFFPTDLKKCEQQGDLLLPILFIFLVVLSVLLYFAVSLMDPGFVLTDTVKVDVTLAKKVNSTPSNFP